MNRITLSRATALLAASFAIAFFSGGCASRSPQATQQPAATAPIEGQIARMNADEKRSLIASSFPIEVPVPRGRVLRAEAQGEDVWDYQMEVAAVPADVAAFYTGWLAKADWQLIGDQTQSDSRTLTLVKGGAESRIVITSAGEGATNVSVVLGVGAPVLNTQ